MKKYLISFFFIGLMVTEAVMYMRRCDTSRTIICSDYKKNCENIQDAGFEVIINDKEGTIILSPRKCVAYMVETIWQQYEPVDSNLSNVEISAEKRQQLWKALAIICRTDIVHQWEKQGKLQTINYDMSPEYIKNIYHNKDIDLYNQIITAVEETRGMVLTYNDNVIEAPFFYLSAGSTRELPDKPYIKKVTCMSDIQYKDFVKIIRIPSSEFWTTLENKVIDETRGEYKLVDHEVNNIMIATDSSGYANNIEIKIINSKNDTSVIKIPAEYFRTTLNLSSPYFTIEDCANKEIVMITSKGIGDGYGMCLVYALELAMEGYGYDEIINYFFNGISLNRRW